MQTSGPLPENFPSNTLDKSARGETSTLEAMEARIKLDLEYLRGWSPGLDLKILALTFIKIFSDDKAY